MPFKLLHLTDTHLWAEKDKPLGSTVLPYHSLVAVLETAAAAATASSLPYDAILVTGDFTHDDTAEAYRHVATLIRSKFPLTPVMQCEGNHGVVDVCIEVFEKEFGFVGRPTAAGGAVAAAPPLVMDLGAHWQIAIVNSHVPGEIYGAVSESDMEFLEKEWLSMKDDEDESSSKNNNNNSNKKHKILALHHPPIHPGMNAGDEKDNSWAEMCLRDPSRRRLRDLLYSSPSGDNKDKNIAPVKLVLHGHLHMDLALSAEQVMHEMRAAAGSEAENSSGYLPKRATAADGGGVSVDIGPLQLCGPATCHQHFGSTWENPPILKHGCRVIELGDDGSVQHRALWAPTVHVVGK